MNRKERRTARARAKPGRLLDYFAELRKANPDRVITDDDVKALEALSITKVLKRDTDWGPPNG